MSSFLATTDIHQTLSIMFCGCFVDCEIICKLIITPQSVSLFHTLHHFIFFVLVGQQRRRLSGFWSSLQGYSWFRWTHCAVPSGILLGWLLLRHIPFPWEIHIGFKLNHVYLFSRVSVMMDSVPTRCLDVWLPSGSLVYFGARAHLQEWVSIIMTLEPNTCGPPRKCMPSWIGYVLLAGAADNGSKKGSIKVIWIE